MAGASRTLELHEAVAEGDATRVRALLAKSRRGLNATDKQGYYPLHVAGGRGDVEMVRLLLERGAKIDATETSEGELGLDDDGEPLFGRTPLHFAAGRGATALVSLLLRRGADANARDYEGVTPLELALESNADAAELLLEHGADVDAGSEYGRTLLHEAARDGDTRKAEFLLDHGADVDAGVLSGHSPLYWAVSSGQQQMAELLLSRGAHANLCDEDGFPLLTCLTSDDSGRPLRLTSEVLVQAGRVGDLCLIQGLAEAGVDVVAHRAKVGPAALAACANGRVELLSWLLDAGLPTHSSNDAGETLLHVASRAGHHTVVNLLADRGAALDAMDNYECDRPLHFAARNGHVDAVNSLIRHGADVNAPNHWGQTPLHAAAQSGCQEVMRSLIEAGANVRRRDQYGRRPLDYLKERESANTTEQGGDNSHWTLR